MKISMTIIADSLEEIKEALNLDDKTMKKILPANAEAVHIEAVKAEPEKVTPAPVKEQEPETPETTASNVKTADLNDFDELDEEMQPEKPVAKQPTMEEARAALNELRKQKGAKVVKALLMNHSAASFTDLDPSEYASIMEEAKNAAN